MPTKVGGLYRPGQRMTVPSFQFLAFFLCAAVIYNLSNVHAWRTAVLFLANFAFLASFSIDPISLLPLAGFLALGYAAVALMQLGPSKAFIPMLLSILAAFFWLKKYHFIPPGLFLTIPYLSVGISYIFFRILHLVIDAHQGALPDRIGIVPYVNYTLNFATLVSGPIQRYQDFSRMQVKPVTLDEIAIGAAFERIIIGFFKVLIVSVAMFELHKSVIATIDKSQSLAARAWIGALIISIYPIFLYFNFSGYTDAVIGAGRLFGIQLPENFDRPFSSENFISFWGRWHITLSNWLKTYVYAPLLMLSMRRFDSPRVDPFLGVFAFFVTFFLVGVWHGQTSEFVFFGFLQGLGVAANKLYQLEMARRIGRTNYAALCANGLYRAITRGLTFVWFGFSLLWFWSDWHVIGTMADRIGLEACIAAILYRFHIRLTLQCMGTM
jgi:alginate O-acetyltransferase complex protein AlgI